MTKTRTVDADAAVALPYPRPLTGGVVAVRKKQQYHHSQLELGSSLINGWVESMRASSPTHAKSASTSASSADGDDEYSAWMAKHPSALSNFEQIAAASMGCQIVMFLDYDGTLSPIVDDPDAAYMNETMRRAVRRLARCFPTAIVSGRCRRKVFEFVKLPELYYAGSHGMDIEAPTVGARNMTKRVLFQPASEFLPMIQEVYQILVEKTQLIPGSKVENNEFCISVHYRCVAEKSWNTVAELVKSVIKGYPMLKLNQGRKVFEIRPTIKWDKGKALEFLLESLGLADCRNVMPVYIGDDRTDEDAFKVLRERGQGISILVSKCPKDTKASYSLRDPAEVMEFLIRMVEWRRIFADAMLK